MPLVRTLIAACDHRQMHNGHDVRTCTVTEELNPYSTQYYRSLIDLGWAIDSKSAGEVLTYCPDHREDAK